MTSLEIAELTGKNHFDLMRAIRKMEPAWEKVNGCKFALVEYQDKKGELRRVTLKYYDAATGILYTIPNAVRI